MAKITLDNLRHSYTATPRGDDDYAVKRLALDWDDGGAYALLGPSGCGKTTLLNLISGLLTPSEGRILFDGADVTHATPERRNIAQVFQFPVIYDTMTVYDNLAFPLRSPARRLAAPEIERRVNEIAEVLHIGHKLRNRSTQLSGGEMQRVAIGRALVRRPSIYLMDEPLSSLDAKLRGELRVELKRIQQDLGATILFVTHDQIEAMTMANRIGVISEGRLIQTGTPREIYEDPNSVYVAQRLGQRGNQMCRRGEQHPVTRLDRLDAQRHRQMRLAHPVTLPLKNVVLSRV